ncbi:hypothetical protein F5I97DRAFT_609700 [Phlebopus sp. FC_14]|nr:hypothetical protein F5I97DRAFT_609700 [Phlebopus sp. FC_14]
MNGHHPSPGDLPCHAHRSPSPSAKQARYSRSASPRRHTPPVCSQTHPQTKAEPQFKDATTDHDSLVPERPRKDEVEPSNSVGSERHKGKVRSEDRKSEVDVVMQSPSPQQGGPRSPLERSRLLVQPHPNAQATASTSPEPSKPAPTLPYLPTIPKYEARPKFSSVYESELSRIEAHRAHAASECKKSWKASRRASHELDMATLDLRAAQHRRELAESHRKRAHHGQLGIEPGVGQ